MRTRGLPPSGDQKYASEDSATCAATLSEVPHLQSHSEALPDSSPYHRLQAVAEWHRPRFTRLDSLKSSQSHEPRQRIRVEADLMRKVVVAMHRSPWAVCIRCLKHKPPIWPKRRVCGTQKTQHFGLVQVLNDVQTCDETEGIAVLFEKVERIHLMDICNHLTRDPDLLGTDIDALNIMIASFSEKVQQPASTAGNIDDRCVLALGQPVAEIILVSLAPDAARRLIEYRGEILEVG